MPEARRSMDGRRMTGPEPWMASTDDAMEAQPCRQRISSIEGVQVYLPNDSPISKRRSGASSVDGAQRHRAETDGAAQATESGARDASARPKQLSLNHDCTCQRLTVPAAMAVASSGLELPSDSPIQRQLKERVGLDGDEAATAIRPRPWMAGRIMAEPWTLFRGR